VEEAVAAALARVRERRGAGEGDADSRSSHASFVRDESMQRVTSVGESRRGSNDDSYGVS
jgi:hypothetical protein